MVHFIILDTNLFKIIFIQFEKFGLFMASHSAQSVIKHLSSSIEPNILGSMSLGMLLLLLL